MSKELNAMKQSTNPEETGIAEENWRVMVKNNEQAENRNLPIVPIKREEQRRINNFHASTIRTRWQKSPAEAEEEKAKIRLVHSLWFRIVQNLKDRILAKGRFFFKLVDLSNPILPPNPFLVFSFLVSSLHQFVFR